MPVYNCAPFLDQAIQSVRCQSLQSLEAVIVDDGSTDDSLSIAKQHAAEDGRIKLFHQANGGIAAALNSGLAHCRGEFIARMDGDDLAEPTRIAAQVNFLDRWPEVGGVGGQFTVIDEQGRVIQPRGPESGEHRYPLDHDSINDALSVGRYAILHPTLTVRREILLNIGGYDERYRYAEDLDLLLRLGEVTRLANLPEIVLRYRKRDASMSSAGVNSYAHWDFQALRGASQRGRSIKAEVLSRAAERASWTAQVRGEWLRATRLAFRSFTYSPFSWAGPRAVARLGLRLLRSRL